MSKVKIYQNLDGCRWRLAHILQDPYHSGVKNMARKAYRYLHAMLFVCLIDSQNETSKNIAAYNRNS